MLSRQVGVVNTPTQSALKALQLNFCLIKLGGQIRIIDRDEIKNVASGTGEVEVNFYKKQDGDTLLRRHLESLPIPSDPKKTITDFWVDPSTHMYDSTAFSPRATPATTLNYWVGPTTAPQPGNWLMLSNFLFEIICNNDQKTYDYLLHFLAHMLQKPEEKPGIMIVLLGQQGTGKGAFFRLIRSIWGRTTLQVSNVDQVIGNFNAALERNFAICMDEAIFVNDRKSMEQLKSLITEPKCRIEQKYQPSRTIDSCHRFFAASNNDHFAFIDRDDRRFLMLRVASTRQDDTDYFTHLFNSIEDAAVVGAMVHDLEKIDLTNFNVRLRPKTKEHLNQKIQSLIGFDRFWYEVLQLGRLPREYTFDLHDVWSNGQFISTSQLIAGFKHFDKNAERYHAIQSQALATKMEKICPSASRSRSQTKGTQERGYDLPHIDVARREFDVAMGGGVDWDWEPPTQITTASIFPVWELEAMRETYELDDGSVGPEDNFGDALSSFPDWELEAMRETYELDDGTVGPEDSL